MGPIGCTETSVRNYHYSLRNNPEERSYLSSAWWWEPEVTQNAWQLFVAADELEESIIGRRERERKREEMCRKSCDVITLSCARRNPKYLDVTESRSEPTYCRRGWSTQYCHCGVSRQHDVIIVWLNAIAELSIGRGWRHGFFIYTFISNQKTSIYSFLWANVLLTLRLLMSYIYIWSAYSWCF